MTLDLKISQLTQGTPTDTDIIPYVDLVSGTTKKALKSELKGDKGDAATLDVGTTTTGLPGTNASVTNIGTINDAIFDFVIPRGDKGEDSIVPGPTGNGIASITLLSTVGLVKTYRITYTDTTTFDFEVTNGVAGTNGTNGRGIVSILRTTGDGSPGTTDIYTITYTDATTSTFSVYNGADGSGGGGGDLLASNNLSDLVDIPTARTNLDVYSTTETDNLLDDKLNKNLTLLDSINLNTITDNGFYCANATCTNLPETSVKTRLRVNQDPTNANLALQEALTTTTLVSYVRKTTDGGTTWSAWTRIKATDETKQTILAEGAFVDGDKTKLDNQSGTNTGDNSPNTNTGLVHTTGDETIAGVKTFSSSPIVPTPTTDYQSATKKYVDDNAGGGGVSVDTITATRVSTASSGTITYSHSLGKIPSIIEVFASYPGYTSDGGVSMGSWLTGDVNKCSYIGAGSTISTGSSTSSIEAIYIGRINGTIYTQVGIIQNVTATNFDIVWTYTGTFTAGNIVLHFTLLG